MKTKKIASFLQRDLWRLRLRDLPRRKAAFYRFLRTFVLAGFQFRDDKCSLRASALTFFTLMSIVPVLAMTFGIAKGFGFEKILEKQLRSAFHSEEGSASPSSSLETADDQTTSTASTAEGAADEKARVASRGSEVDRVVDQVISFANSMLASTKGGLIAGVGLAVLLWTVIKVLGSIEASFNDIWGIKRPRPWLRKFTDYLSFLFVTPILLFLSQGLTVFLTSQVTAIVNRLSFLGFLGGLILFALRFLPFVIVWVMFTFTYMFMPNTRVKLKSALAAGVFAGTVFQLFQWIYINTQFGVTKANAIYGSFAALPLFLTWLQVSWMVVLFGAELSYAHQNIDLYEWMEESKNASPAYRRMLTLAIVHNVVSRFARGLRPPTLGHLARRLDAPPRLVRECVDRLLAAHVLVEVLPPGLPGGEVGYHPVADIENLRITDVFEKLDVVGYSSLPLVQAPAVEKLSQYLESLREGLRSLPANVPLKDIPDDFGGEASDDESFRTYEGVDKARPFPLGPA